MLHLLVTISKYTIMIMFAIYTYDCFAVLRRGMSQWRRERMYKKQTTLIYLILLNANAVLLCTTMDFRILIMSLAEMIFIALTLLIYNKIYKGASLSVVNNMCMLLTISFIVLTRLNMNQAIRQFGLACVALVITCLIPLFISKLKFLSYLSFLYALIGIGGLGVVAIAGSTEYGAKLNISLGPVTIQPSEFIKILFVFFVASVLYEWEDLSELIYATAVAMLHVLLLIASKDLGGAAIFLVTYLAMIYVATKKPIILIGGLGLGAIGSFLAYKLFTHVQNRVIAWLDPLSVIDNQGYQVSQSLFAIGTGGWFGSGLGQGMPDKIPVVTKDFVFAAISEEMGGVVALCLIFVCISCLLMFFNISMSVKDSFYKLVALGLGTVYGIQVFLTLGGVTKFIPSTGVTLPLVSYGGSSLLSTMILFAVIQGLYIIRNDQESEVEDGKTKRTKRNRSN
ncbi:MAG: FtsW/RodA/SpoVE family cell cycle protein [Lachnospiraceae bacterium]|nr:FtsW/RodA/SpoVE family cell cycle protein [Lachnospiraceae bacterium]